MKQGFKIMLSTQFGSSSCRSSSAITMIVIFSMDAIHTIDTRAIQCEALFGQAFTEGHGAKDGQIIQCQSWIHEIIIIVVMIIMIIISMVMDVLGIQPCPPAKGFHFFHFRV